jgi:tRNA(adenine34) deaminase
LEITAGGVLEEECRTLIQGFFKLKRAAGTSDKDGTPAVEA